MMTDKQIENPQEAAEDLSTLHIDGNVSQVNVGKSSVIGRRDSQQDAIKTDGDYVFAEEGRGIAVLCDGMGGLSGGEKASNLCVDLVHKLYHEMAQNGDIALFYSRAISQADEGVVALRDENGNPLRAGTTMISVVIDDGKLHWASVGDSRIYIQRRNEILQLTKDHNLLMLLNEKVKNGQMTQEEANRDPKREALISYIGINGVRYVSRNRVPLELEPGDHIILCSDGLYRSVGEQEMLQIVQCFAGDMDSAAEAMTQLAMSKGNRHQDNTSVVILEFVK